MKENTLKPDKTPIRKSLNEIQKELDNTAKVFIYISNQAATLAKNLKG